jgi:hypothetical protein
VVDKRWQSGQSPVSLEEQQQWWSRVQTRGERRMEGGTEELFIAEEGQEGLEAACSTREPAVGTCTSGVDRTLTRRATEETKEGLTGGPDVFKIQFKFQI